MDSGLEALCKEILEAPQTEGCLLANAQGLCLEAKGKVASPESSGILVALSEQAAKLEPNSNPPTVILDYKDLTCFIQKHDAHTTAVYRRKK
uniref:Late endosomal/lysosomal adaptor and MAPK and MTOR activator 5 n=1 Tax=Nyssomyia neivai TaxID=330878 RepID=A0A1L8DAA1_9DIPT